MIRTLAFAVLVALSFAGSAAAEGTLCKDQCVKSCMGNDTPTERANCLIRENCDSRPACPAGSFGSTTGFFLDYGSTPPTPPKPGVLVPMVNRSDVLVRSLPQ